MVYAYESARIFLGLCKILECKIYSTYFSLIPQQMCNFAPILSIIVIE